jgi:ABC-type Na+ efflux pump permease subunit
MNKKNWGWGLVIISFIPWLSVAALPWLPLTNSQRLLASAVLIVMAEVLFWLGALIVGKQAINRYRQHLNWRSIRRIWRKFLRW